MKILLISTAIIVGLGGSFVAYYKVSQNKLISLVEANSKLTMAITQQQAAIDSIESKYRIQAESFSGLLSANAVLSAEKEKLSTKLMEHDLEELSKRKPALVEKRINDGTKELFSSFTSITSN